ncbi:hypothetical protein E3P86_03499 [Wallemia ichthyophaga]|uniref:DUF7330 domain-containing protein n=1 Tax=Wallemia ichthyophaga TaxID=245174 RepID=A0A4T0IKP1_WALIC|nr:hypothetical protein E3P86_03499 [Wallemia ichthyophaga]
MEFGGCGLSSVGFGSIRESCGLKKSTFTTKDKDDFGSFKSPFPPAVKAHTPRSDMSTTSNIFQPPEPYSYTPTDLNHPQPNYAVPAPPAGLHPQQAHLRQTHRMPIRGSFHIATGAAFHTAENDTEAALQGPSARFETNDGYVDVRVWVSGGSGIATVEASSKSGRVKVEVVDCPSRLPLRLQAKSKKGPVQVLLPPCFSGLLIADAQTINLSEGAQNRATQVVGFANRFLIAGLDGSTRGGSEVKIDALNADAKIAFARENLHITPT